MKTIFKAENPKDILMSMTVTMTMGEWSEIAESFKEIPHYKPGGKLLSAIRSMSQQAHANFRDETDDAE